MTLGLGVTSAHAKDALFLALGDSYTIGEGVEPDGRWPDQLAAALRKSGERVSAPEIVARTGWTTDELAAAMDQHAFRPPYDLVTLMIGVNNQYRAGQEPKCPEGHGGPGGAAGQEPKCPEGHGGPGGAAGQEPECPGGHGWPRGAGRDLDNYRSEFRTLLERAIALAGDRPQRVVVVSIPDWGVTRFGRHSGRDTAKVAHELDLYNAANAEIAASLHVRYADVTPASRDGGDRADMLVGDGLHPSAAMYRRWLAAIEPQARAALAED